MKVSQKSVIRCLSIAFFAVNFIFAGDVHGERIDARKIVKRVGENLDNIKTFSCTFEFIRYSRESGYTRRNTGTIQMKKPYLFRVERPDHIIVVDGEKVWTYLPKNKQAQLSDFDGEEDTFPSPYSVFRRYVDKREALPVGKEEVNGSECDVIHLLSPDSKDTRVIVWIDLSLDFPVKAVEETQAGDMVTHVLSDIKINEKMDDDIFTFSPPKGISIIDLRE
ncbi:outer membrane lipoprotein carrier protein LolA [Candidatus Latescibacterota bacterium]